MDNPKILFVITLGLLFIILLASIVLIVSSLNYEKKVRGFEDTKKCLYDAVFFKNKQINKIEEFIYENLDDILIDKYRELFKS